MCILFVVSTSVIPSSAGDWCPNGHITGVKVNVQWECYGPNDDYCCECWISWNWSCCWAYEIEIFNTEPHDFVMTGASYITCTKCGYGRPVK